MRTHKLPYNQGQYVRGFFITAYEDYLAARQLLLNNLLIQGCILANTSIEKYFKGMKAILGEDIPRHHDISVRKFKNTLENKFNRLYKLINFEFLEFLSKSYKLRYFDEIENDFSIAIIKVKTLAELYFIIYEIENSFSIIDPKQENKDNRYTVDKKSKNPQLWDHNYYLKDHEKQNYFERPDNVYEFRKLHNGEILQIYYVTDKIINDGKFIYDAISPKVDNPKSFTYCFEPLGNK